MKVIPFEGKKKCLRYKTKALPDKKACCNLRNETEQFM